MPFLGVTYTRTFIGSPARRDGSGTGLSLSQMSHGEGAGRDAGGVAARAAKDICSGGLALRFDRLAGHVSAHLVGLLLEVGDGDLQTVQVGAVLGGVAGKARRLFDLSVAGAHHLRRVVVEVGAIRAVGGGGNAEPDEMLLAGGQSGVGKLERLPLRPLAREGVIGMSLKKSGTCPSVSMMSPSVSERLITDLHAGRDNGMRESVSYTHLRAHETDS